MLVTLWTADPGRFTRDVDFLGFGDSDEETLRKIFTEVLSIGAGDGLVFDTGELTASEIREEQVYGGNRLRTTAYLERTKIPITIDIGFGDALTAPEYEIDYGSLLDFDPAKVRAYSPASVIAEKYQAIVALGLINGRMKDFYDLWAIPKSTEIKPKDLAAAIKATFDRRDTPIPFERPPGLSQEFAEDPVKIAQWTAYSEATELGGTALSDVVDEIWTFISGASRQETTNPEI